MKKKYLYMLPIILSLLMMVSCSDQCKVYNNVDEWVAEVTPTVESIKVETLHAMLDTGAMVLLIDVREANEFNPGYIPGSVNIPRGIIEFKIANDEFWEAQFLYPPLKTDEVILICKKGKRSIMTVDAVKKLGFENVKYLDGGFKKWELTYPLEQDKNLDQVHGDGGEVGGC
ncbi:MAG: hypothetical protein GQ527_02620 [Bacteroidales bacterium]|nr:hypothetical protein [Bacteroidales bacterium]